MFAGYLAACWNLDFGFGQCANWLVLFKNENDRLACKLTYKKSHCVDKHRNSYHIVPIVFGI